MKIIIDRFEGDYAVVELENLDMVDLPRAPLPDGALEGDVLEIRIDKDETAKRKKDIKKLMDSLWE